MDDNHTHVSREIPEDGGTGVAVDTQIQEDQAMTESMPSSDFERVMKEYLEEENEDEEEEEAEAEREDEEEEELVHVQHEQEESAQEEDVEPDDNDDNDDNEEEYSDEDDDDDDEDLQIPYGPVTLPMPDNSGFTIALPDQDAPPPSPPPPPPLAPLPDVLHVPDLLIPYDLEDPSPSLQGLHVCHLGRETKLTGEMQAMYLRLPPGTRMSRPVANRLGDVIVYCISGSGLVWQNGWTFPFASTDTVGWKAGTGIPHTIINDSNADSNTTNVAQDLILLVAYEDKPNESYHYPFTIDKDFAIASGKQVWSDPPRQGDIGPHPGVPSIGPERANSAIPACQVGYRPSNLINTISELDAIGEGELFANATSLSQETGMSGRFGCNFEVPPPGARSSEPHAHSLEDELVYIVSGTANVWLNGNIQPVREGDVLGFPAGTGIAHNFINDSNADGDEGEPLMLWILGQNRVREGDLVYYPLKVNEAVNVNSKRWWPNPPIYELGPHDGHAKRPLRFY